MLSLEVKSEVGQLLVELYDENNKRVFYDWIYGSSENPGKLKWTFGLNSKINYMKISDGSNKIYTGKYSITSSFKAANNNDSEPNNGTTIANNLPLNSTMVGFLAINDNLDMYRIDVNNKEKVTINLETEIKSTLVELYDDNNKRIFFDWVYGSEVTPGKYKKEITLSPGKYYIRVSDGYSNKIYTGKYNLSANTNTISQINSIQGKDRFETAGLSASGLSGVVGAPILYTNQNEIPEATNKRLSGVNKVYIIGSEAAISKNIESKLKSRGIQIVRLGGKDRYETSYNVTKEISKFKRVDTILLVNGYKGEADAISVASVASRDGMPIILIDGNSVPFSTSGVKTYVIGGESIMSENLRYKTNATRLGGVDRFDTNKKVIQHFYSNTKEFHLAKSDNMVDSLVASTISKNAPIVLVNNGSDKTVLKGATRLTRVRFIDKAVQDECLKAAKQ